MPKIGSIFALGTLCLCLIISSCSQNVSPTTYQVSEVGRASKVIPGVIIAKRSVTIDANSGAGGLTGVAAGATAGSTVGGGGVSHILGALGGAVIGGLAGDKIDKSINQHRGLEYIIKLKNGKTISVVQADEMKFALKQRVLVIYGEKTRIIPDETLNADNRQRA